MTAAKSNYSLAGEAFKSFAIGLLASLVIGIVLWLCYAAYDVGLMSHSFAFAWNGAAFSAWLTEISRFVALAFVFAFMFFLVGTFQFGILALPVAVVLSRGLDADAKRSWLFYLTTAIVVGAVPWIFLVVLNSKISVESLIDNAVLVYPTLSTSVLAGAILKRRLVKRAAAAGIEKRMI